MKRSFQATFNKVSTHLLAQAERCVDPVYNTPRYRNRSKYCAVGCLIPTDLHTSEIENQVVIELYRLAHSENISETQNKVYNHLMSLRPHGCTERSWIVFLWHLQRIHDSIPPSKWKAKLRLVAQIYGLTPTAK